MLYTRIKRCLSRLLFEIIPTYLLHMLENYFKQVAASKTSLTGHRPVYDLVNSGPNHRFMVLGKGVMTVHNCGYGMGPNKLKDTLNLEGIPCTGDEAFQLWTAYWNLFSGIKKYEKTLQREWERRHGWVRGLWGQPVCVAEDYKKDLVNRVVQGSGHLFQMKVIEHLFRLRQERGLHYQGLIWDFHDQTVLQTPADEVDATFECLAEAYRRANLDLQKFAPKFDIVLKGVPQQVPTLSEAKVEG